MVDANALSDELPPDWRDCECEPDERQDAIAVLGQMERRIVDPECNVEELFPHLRFGLEGEASTREYTLVKKEVVNRDRCGIGKNEIGDLPGNVPHVSSTERTFAAAEKLRVVLLRLQNQPRGLQPPAGENDPRRLDADFASGIAHGQGGHLPAILRQLKLGDGSSEQDGNAR